MVGRSVTPMGLILIVLVALVISILREWLGQEPPEEREAEVRRVQARMKQYQHAWEEKRTDEEPKPK